MVLIVNMDFFNKQALQGQGFKNKQGIKMINKHKGFSLVEATIVLGVLSTATIGVIHNRIDNAEKQAAFQIIQDAATIIQAVDHRIALDGYDPSLWVNKEWNNNNDVLNVLIKKDLVSQNSTSCSGGAWNPVNVNEQQAKIIECGLWENKNLSDLDFKASLNTDGLGFIQNFDLDISFTDQDAFSQYYKTFKQAISEVGKYQNQISGEHEYSFYSKNTNTQITNTECITEGSDCYIKMRFNREGGEEYIRADGKNSLIEEHLTFVDTIGNSPMKCIRWKNTNTDGTGAWTSSATTNDENCGIGVYDKENPQPAVADIVAETGTFENVLLNQECNLYSRDAATNTVSQNGKSPCGALKKKNGSVFEILQVVDSIYAENILSEEGSFNLLNVDKLVSNDITTETMKSLTQANIKDVNISEWVTITGSITSLQDATATTKMKAPVGDFDNVNIDLEYVETQINNMKLGLNNLDFGYNAKVSTWQATSWGSCSASCGGGTQNRNVYCPSGKVCVGNKPSRSQSCNTQACPVPVCLKTEWVTWGQRGHYKLQCVQWGETVNSIPRSAWTVSAWSSCTTGACTGTQTRRVTCSAKYCDLNKPITTQTCYNSSYRERRWSNGGRDESGSWETRTVHCSPPSSSERRDDTQRNDRNGW